MLTEKLSGLAVLLVGNCQQKMLGRDILVLHLIGLLLRSSKNLTKARTEILLSALHAGKSRDGRLTIVQHNLDVGADLTEQRTYGSFRLFEHRAEQMLRLDLLILVPLSQFDASLDRFLPAKCEFI